MVKKWGSCRSQLAYGPQPGTGIQALLQKTLHLENKLDTPRLGPTHAGSILKVTDLAGDELSSSALFLQAARLIS